MEGSMVIINVLIQIVNLVIFFFVFKYLFAWPIVQAVEKRKKILNQFKNADEILQKKLTEAEEEKQKLIQEGIEHKNKLLQEAKQQSERYRQFIIEQAEYEKNNIIEKWKQEIENERKELEKYWEESVKKGIYTIYEKLIWKDEDFIKKYTDKVNLKDYKA